MIAVILDSDEEVLQRMRGFNVLKNNSPAQSQFKHDIMILFDWETLGPKSLLLLPDWLLK